MKKSKKSINVEGGRLWRGEFFKISKHDVTLIREIRVAKCKVENTSD